MYPHIRIPAYPHTRIPAYPHTRISAYPHTRISAYPHTRVPAYPHIRIPAFSTKPFNLPHSAMDKRSVANTEGSLRKSCRLSFHPKRNSLLKFVFTYRIVLANKDLIRLQHSAILALAFLPHLDPKFPILQTSVRQRRRFDITPKRLFLCLAFVFALLAETMWN